MYSVISGQYPGPIVFLQLSQLSCIPTIKVHYGLCANLFITFGGKPQSRNALVVNLGDTSLKCLETDLFKF